MRTKKHVVLSAFFKKKHAFIKSPELLRFGKETEFSTIVCMIAIDIQNFIGIHNPHHLPESPDKNGFLFFSAEMLH